MMRRIAGFALAVALVAWPATTDPGEPPVASPTPTPQEKAEGQSSGGSLERFRPSEKLPADSAISFPVDI